MTRLIVSEDIFRVFPDAVLGVVTFRNIDNSGRNEEVMSSLRNEQERTKERFAATAVPEHPHILPWREAYRKFGAKPKDNPSSIENLVRRVLKGHRLAHINLLVDIYNTISLRYILPVGGEDLDTITGDIELTFATDREPPVQLLGEGEARPPKRGEVIYKDSVSAICRRWNWKEADRTKFTEATRNGFLVIERLAPVDITIVKHATGELAQLVKAYCGGDVSTASIDASNREISL